MLSKAALIFGLFTSLAANALGAESPLEALRLANPQLNNYQLLEKFYEQAPSALDLGSLDAWGKKPTIQCAGVFGGSQNVVEFCSPMKLKFIVTPGRPAQGPLLPATPAVYNETITESCADDTSIAQQYTRVDEVEHDLIWTASIPSYYTTHYPMPLIVRFRNNQGMIAAKHIVGAGTPREAVNYFYCWKK